MHDPDRQEVIAEICDCLDEGDEMVAEYQCPRPFGPITIIFTERPPSKQEWRLDGLWPTECDSLRSHLLEVEWRDGPDPMHEMCVVATLATLLHERGVRLDPATVIFLHGKAERRYARVSFVEAVEQVGWDKAADFLVEQQEKRDRKDQAPTIRRRGPGRQKDSKYDALLRDQFLKLGSVTAVAKKIASQRGTSQASVHKYIGRAEWYKKLPGPAPPKKRTKQPSKPPLATAETPGDRIEQYLRTHSIATTNEIASALRLREPFINEILRHQPSRFRYLPGDRWTLV
jgi:hypothetical protein